MHIPLRNHLIKSIIQFYELFNNNSLAVDWKTQIIDIKCVHLSKCG